MTDQELDAIEALAKSATSGPWRFERRAQYPQDYDIFAGDISIMQDTAYYPSTPDEVDAQFIAAANPSSVMELIELARRTLQAEEALRKIRAGHTMTVEYDLSPAMVESALRQKLIELGWTPPKG